MKRILVPCDFSKPSEEAFRTAVSIASKGDGEIHVLYVMDITFLHGKPTLSHAYAFNLNFLKDEETEAERKFQALWEKHAPLTLPVKFRYTIGSLLSDIDNYVRQYKIDLIVMGTHGAGNFGWGSNTEKVVTLVKIPVLSIRQHPTNPVQNVIVPVLPGWTDTHFITEVNKLQEFYKATIHLLWINTPHEFKSDASSREDLQQFAANTGLSNYSLNTRSDYTVEEGIYRFAKEINADMIAMATHGRTGLARRLRGSIAGDIVSHIDIPVWTIQPNKSGLGKTENALDLTETQRPSHAATQI